MGGICVHGKVRSLFVVVYSIELENGDEYSHWFASAVSVSRADQAPVDRYFEPVSTLPMQKARSKRSSNDLPADLNTL